MRALNIILTLSLLVALLGCDDTPRTGDGAPDVGSGADVLGGDDIAREPTPEPRRWGEACDPERDTCAGDTECTNVAHEEVEGLGAQPDRWICTAVCSTVRPVCLGDGWCVGVNGKPDYCAAPDDPRYHEDRECDLEDDDCGGLTRCHQVNGLVSHCKLPCTIDRIEEHGDYSSDCYSIAQSCGSYLDGDEPYCF